MSNETPELVALLNAALTLLQDAHPDHPGVQQLVKQRDAWQRRQAPADPTNTTIEVASILSHRTKEGRIELTVNREKTQLDLAKAREIVGMLQGAIEAAVSDQLLFAFLTTKAGLSADHAGRALLDFRELRQGTRTTVFPS